MNTTKTLQTETNQSPKPRGYRFWLIRFALLVGLPILLYYGYCWGLWGRGSLLLQYFFQCNCPPASEEARYPDNVNVIVPACHYISSTTSPTLSPSGKLLHVRTIRFGHSSSYLLNLQTMESIDVTDQPFSDFLTDDLWFAESGSEDIILDRITRKRYAIQEFRYWRENAYVDGKPNLDLLISALHQAKQVFYIQNNDVVVVLISDLPVNSEENFTFGLSVVPGWNSNQVEEFLQENNVIYQTVPARFPYPNERISPDERFVARTDGIYLVETGQKIVEGYVVRGFYHPYSGKYFGARGWTHDGTGVIYSRNLNPCLFETSFFTGDYACFIKVPQPVIKLKLPEEYLLP